MGLPMVGRVWNFGKLRWLMVCGYKHGGSTDVTRNEGSPDETEQRGEEQREEILVYRIYSNVVPSKNSHSAD